VVEDLVDDLWLGDDGQNPHVRTTPRTDQGIGFVHQLDETSPGPPPRLALGGRESVNLVVLYVRDQLGIAALSPPSARDIAQPAIVEDRVLARG